MMIRTEAPFSPSLRLSILNLPPITAIKRSQITKPNPKPVGFDVLNGTNGASNSSFVKPEPLSMIKIL